MSYGSLAVHCQVTVAERANMRGWAYGDPRHVINFANESPSEVKDSKTDLLHMSGVMSKAG